MLFENINAFKRHLNAIRNSLETSFVIAAACRTKESRERSNCASWNFILDFSINGGKKLLTFFFIWWAIDRILTISVGKDMLAGQGGLNFNSSRNQVLISNSGRIKYYLLN
jgi:hypothetical protein